MTSSELRDEETARQYDAVSGEKFAAEVLDPTVDYLARQAGAGPALEFPMVTGTAAAPALRRNWAAMGSDTSIPETGTPR